MGTEQQTIRKFRTVAGGDVGCLQRSAVKATEGGELGGHRKTIGSKLLLDPAATGIVGVAVHDTGSEGTLTLTELIGAISAEHRTDGGHRDGIIADGGLSAQATTGQE